MELSGQHDFINMGLYDALNLALRLSRKSRDDVAAEMGWTPGNADRIFGTENYWPTLPNIPRLCIVLGNNILIDWLHAQAHAGGVKHHFPALDCGALLLDMNQLMRDLGDAAKEGERAVTIRPGELAPRIDPAEASRLIKRLLSLCTDTIHTIRGLRPIAGGGSE